MESIILLKILSERERQIRAVEWKLRFHDSYPQSVWMLHLKWHFNTLHSSWHFSNLHKSQYFGSNPLNKASSSSRKILKLTISRQTIITATSRRILFSGLNRKSMNITSDFTSGQSFCSSTMNLCARFHSGFRLSTSRTIFLKYFDGNVSIWLTAISSNKFNVRWWTSSVYKLAPFSKFSWNFVRILSRCVSGCEGSSACR